MNDGLQITVTGLRTYPVKSCAAVTVPSMALDARGFAHDRRWMIAGKGDYIFLSQRSYPRMALVRPTIEPEHLRLAAPGMEDLIVPISDDRTSEARNRGVQARIWLDLCDAIDDGDAAAEWLSTFLRVPCRLVHMPDDTIRAVDPKYSAAPASVGFADAYPILLISQASLDHLNEKLDTPVPMDRFRPNIVIEGCAPHEEDTWKRIRIGGIEFDVAKPCVRCSIPTIDQTTAENRGPEPLRTLATYRKEAMGITFGQNLIHRGAGAISLGDQVEPVL